MKNVAFLFLLLGLTFQLSAKEIVFRLKLVDPINEVFIPNVRLIHAQTNTLIGTTNANGYFAYSLKTTETTIRFETQGYEDTTVTLKGKSQEIVISLKPTAETISRWESALTIECDSLNRKFIIDPDSLSKFNEAKHGPFFRFIAKNVVYPTYAIENGIQGKVYISFIVGADGKIHCPKIVKGASPALNREAIRVIQQMPAWIPAQKNNLSVASLQSIPISFKLQ